MSRTLPEGIQWGPVGVWLRPRILVVGAVLLAVLAVVVVLAVGTGSSRISVPDTLDGLLGRGAEQAQFIVRELRLPRVAGAVAIGWCLGLAGALTQTLSRNPLATPDILGVTSGASLGAVSAIVLGGGAYSVGASLLGVGIPALAIIGGLATTVVIYLLGWKRGVVEQRFILIGIGATAVLDGMTTLLLYRAQLSQAAAASQWLVGSVSGLSWSSVQPVLVVGLIATALAMLLGPGLGTTLLGDDVAQSLGTRVQTQRLAVIGLAAVLASVAVSASGPVTFVALVSPQIAVRLAGGARPPLLLSGLCGGLLVVGADLIGRNLTDHELPVGILTALVGAPFLIAILIRHRKDPSAR